MGKNILYLFLFVTIMFGSCTENNPVPEADVYKIKSIGLLSTTEYTIGKIIKLDDNNDWYKYGDRKILISVKAKVKAGINLMELTEDDIKVKANTITINLPPVQITSFQMDPSTVRTEMEDVNGFRMNFSQIEKNEILKLGEKSIRDNLNETGIIEEAEKNAISFITDFYKQMGYEKVNVNLSKMESNE